MRRIFTLLVSMLMVNLASGQAIKASLVQVNFQATDELGTDSVLLYISQSASASGFGPVSVTDINFYDTYGRPAFSASDTSFVIGLNDSVGIYVRFHPRHNILHDSEMVIENDGMRGFLSIDLQGQGTYSMPYYSGSQNLSEQPLKQALQTITGAGYTSFSYNVARDNMYGSIDNHSGYVTCVYTLDSAQFNTRAGANVADFNCEHTFPQSLFSQNLPMRSDIHHLFPTRTQPNGSRGNLPFGTASTPYQQVSINAPSKLGSNNLYEPQDGQKGGTARAMMYFVIRYQDYSNFFAPQQSILKQWNADFSPEAREIGRNNAIFALQNNRNPFVDYPQFAERISSFSTNSVAPVMSSIDQPQDSANYGQVSPGTFTYNLVLVNDGSSILTFSAPSFSSGALSLTGAATQTVQEGEALALKILLNASQVGSFSETFNFSLTGPGFANTYAVPVTWQTTATGLADIADPLEMLKIWPNPSRGELYISNPLLDGKPLKLDIYDLLGKRVLMKETASLRPDSSMDVSSLAPGMYLVRVIGGGSSKTMRLIIE